MAVGDVAAALAVAASVSLLVACGSAGKARLPRIVELFRADYVRTRPRLSRLQMHTSAGAALQALLLRRYDTQRRRLLRLQEAVAGGGYAWGEVLRWLEENERELARFDSRLGSILRTLPPAERQAVAYAISR